jgi:hypothetical protein
MTSIARVIRYLMSWADKPWRHEEHRSYFALLVYIVIWSCDQALCRSGRGRAWAQAPAGFVASGTPTKVGSG